MITITFRRVRRSWETLVVTKEQVSAAVRDLDADPNVVKRHVMGHMGSATGIAVEA